jgi:hypothetical protein
VISTLARAYFVNHQPDAAEKLLLSTIAANKELSFAYTELFHFYCASQRFVWKRWVLGVSVASSPSRLRDA